jgi:hypothetical protein
VNEQVRVKAQKKQVGIDTWNRMLTKPLSFVEGDVVAVMDPKINQNGAQSKLFRRWVGPCKVLRKRSATNYVIQQMPVGLTGTVNVGRMKKWTAPVSQQHPLQSQQHQQQQHTAVKQVEKSNMEWVIFPKESSQNVAQSFQPAAIDVPVVLVPVPQQSKGMATGPDAAQGAVKEPGRPTQGIRTSSRVVASTRKPEFEYSKKK